LLRWHEAAAAPAVAALPEPDTEYLMWQDTRRCLAVSAERAAAYLD
jgi:hypothetical protein